MIAVAEPGDRVGPLGQRAIADDRILRIGVDVEHRRVVERDADRSQLARQRARKSLGQLLGAARGPASPSAATRVNGSFRRATRPPS